MHVSSSQVSLLQLPSEVITKVLNHSRLSDLREFAQADKKSREVVEGIKVDLNNTGLNLNSFSSSVEESPSDVESATTSSPSWKSLIDAVQSQLGIGKIAVQNLSADDVIKELAMQKVIKHSWYLQQPIGFEERKELIKESQENLDSKLQYLEQKIQAINDFCDQVVEHLRSNGSVNSEKDVDELRTGLRFMICEQLKNNLDDWKNRDLLINIKTENQTDEKQCITFSLNSQITKTYKIKRLDNKELQLYNLTSGVEQGEEGICDFKIKPIARGEMKVVEKRGRSEPETMWVEVRDANDAVYEGQWKDNERNGQGIMRFDNGDVYDGQWVYGKIYGQGIMRFDNGDVYDGQWVDWEMHGQGTYTHVNGDFYDGEWTNSVMTGQGKKRYGNGDVYDGEWVDCEMHGQGTYTHVNGDVYEGQYENGQRHGQGTFTFSDGSIYTGEWQKDLMAGHGTKIYATNGSKYSGGWKDNKKHGQGTYICADGTVHTGYWDGDEVNESCALM